MINRKKFSLKIQQISSLIPSEAIALFHKKDHLPTKKWSQSMCNIQVLIFGRICLTSIHRRCYAKCIEGDSFHFYVLRESRLHQKQLKDHQYQQKNQ